MISDEQIARARAVSLLDVACEHHLRRQGAEYIGPCPRCGGTDRFAININRGLWNCRGCEMGGDVIALAQFSWDCDFNAAVERLTGKPPPKTPNCDAVPWRTEGEWVYVNADEKPYLRVVRKRKPDGTKVYVQYHFQDDKWVSGKPRGPKIPYRLPHLVDSDRTEPVFIVEGEKCADRLAKESVAVTTSSEGAGKWTPDLNRHFARRIVWIIPDADEPGRRHARQVAANLHGVAREVRILELTSLKDGQDVFDFLEDGGAADDLRRLGDAAPIWEPPSNGLFGEEIADKVASRPDYRGDPGVGAQHQQQSGARPKREAIHSWEEPNWSLLEDRRGDLPDFPVDTLGMVCGDWVKHAAHSAGVTTGHVAVPLLGISSSLIGTSRRVQAVPAWSEPMTLWTAIVGFSGDGKTPGINTIKDALDVIIRNRGDLVDDLRRAHDTKVEAAKAALAAWKDAVKEAVANGRTPPRKPADADDPGKFVAPRLYASDVTIERLGELLTARPQGMSLIADELASLFLNMGRYSGGCGSDAEFWLEAWVGKSYVVERMSRPPLHIRHLLVGVCGGLQPEKLAKSFEGPADGMYARFLFAWPERSGYRPLADTSGGIEPAILNALSRLSELGGERPENFAPSYVPLSKPALAVFEQLRQHVDVRVQATDGREREWLAKCPGHTLRLAGTLAFLDWGMTGGAEPTEVNAGFMQAAVTLIRDYFAPHARAALRQIGLSERDADARRVLRWMQQAKQETVSREDVRRTALAQKLNADETQALLERLARAGWVREQTEPRQGAGRPSVRWAVNPLLFGSGP
jgi:hypothetical protein